MTQYDEYLQYLKHVDDTTLQDFEKEKRKLTSEIETCRTDISTLTHKANMYEQLYNNAQPKLKSLSSIRGLFVALITICSFGTLLILYFFYWIFNLKNYFSINRWIQCDKYDSPWVVKRL